jgi:GntP family gluconate:H+ symporter
MLLLLLVLSVIFIIVLTTRLNVHPFLALLGAALLFALLSGMPFTTIVQSINEGFGGTLGKIGLVIILGVIIGAFLEYSGGAFRLAEAVLQIIGRKRVHEAMGIMGFIVAIPVFVDSGFILLNPLNRSISKQAKVSLAGTAVALALGLMLTHVMVPPTPGPIAAAGILGADVGLVMLIGLIISTITLVFAIFFAKRIASKIYIDPAPELTEEEVIQKIKNSPSVFKSFLPILIPILLIVGKSVIEFSFSKEALQNNFAQILLFVGTPVIALFIGMLLSFLLPKKLSQDTFSTNGLVGKSIMSAANILLITGAGGIFGTILQNSNLADLLANTLSNFKLGVWLPFLLAATIKTAQGSSTIAIITTASIVAPLLSNLGFDTAVEKAIAVVAIGAGSAVISHANDSAFWVVTQLSSMDVKTGYRIYSTGTLLIGIVAASLLFLLSLWV